MVAAVKSVPSHNGREKSHPVPCWTQLRLQPGRVNDHCLWNWLPAPDAVPPCPWLFHTPFGSTLSTGAGRQAQCHSLLQLQWFCCPSGSSDLPGSHPPPRPQGPPLILYSSGGRVLTSADGWNWNINL